MNLSEFHLLRPAWLLALIPLAFALWRLSRDSGGAAAWRGLVDAHLLPHLLAGGEGRRHRLPLLLLGVAGVLATLALAGPVWQRLPAPAFQAQAERVIVLDLSRDMNATDLAPSRLAHARYEVLDLLHRFREGQTALIAYSAEPYVVSPLTGDARTIAAQVPELSSDLLPVEGAKQTGLALEEAGKLLTQAGSVHGQVILVTDGLDNPAAALEAARALKQQGYRLSVLGVGTASGAPVPAENGGFVHTANGAVSIAKLDSATLRSLASTGGGRYVTASMDDSDVEALVADAPVQRSQTGDGSIVADQWREEGPWLLLVLLPLAALAFRRGWISPLLLVVFLLPAPRADAFGWKDLWQRPDQQAAALLQQGDAKNAAQRFQRPDWRAAASYEAGDYQDALDTLKQHDADGNWYNRGNTLARLGDYQQAVKAYEKAITHDPDDADAKHNLDLIKRLLEAQKPPQSQPKGGESGQGNQAKEDNTSQQGGASPQDQSSNGGKENAKSGSQQADTRQSADNGKSSAGQQADAQSQQASAQASQEQSGESGKQNAENPPASAGDAKDENTSNTPEAAQAPAGDNSKQKPETAPASAGRARQENSANAQDASQAQAGDAAATNANASNPPTSGSATDKGANEPGLADLLGNPAGAQAPGTAKAPPMTEAQQAMENQLNRVPDDPAGLLRQRFLLQHLRRTGQL